MAERERFKYIDISSIAKNAIVEPREIAPSAAPSRARQRITAGDTIYSCVRVYLENIALVPDQLDGEVASTAFAVLRPADGIDAGYLHWLVRRAQFTREMTARQRGNSPPAVLESDVKGAEVPLAPTAEQHRIALRINELFGEIEAGEQELEKAREGLETYRRAVLKAAVTGELTKEWRQRNSPRETGADFLTRILKERRAAWEQAELAKMAAKGKLPRSDAWKARYVEPEAPDRTNLPSLPQGWVWASLEQLCHLAGGVTVDAKRSGDNLVEVPYLRVANVQRGTLDLSTLRKIWIPREKLDQLRLMPNDVLINEGGDKDKVGRGWVWSGEVADCIHQNHVFRARPIIPELDGRFISAYGNEVGRSYFFAEARQTTNLASISLRKVKALPVPVPPAAEIKAIVSIVTEVQSDAEAFEAVYAAAQTDSDRLRQSILAAAFLGKLVPQNPAEEPALALLERLRRENGSASGTGHAHRTTKFIARVRPHGRPRKVQEIL